MSLPVLMVLVPGAVVCAAVLSLCAPPKKRRSVEVGERKEGQTLPRRHVQYADHLVDTKDGLTTIPQLMRATFEKYGSHPAMGTRKTVRTEEKEVTVKVDGKDVTRKHKIPWQTDYQFRDFTQMGQEISAFGAGLLKGTQTPLQFGDKISLFAGTRPEWQITAQAAFEHGLVVVTASLMDVVARTAGSLKDSLRCVIYMDELTPTQVQTYQKQLGRELISWNTVMERGVQLVQQGQRGPARSPQPKDIAVIMYTSGSTGTPKGVLMSHANIVAAIAGIGAFVPEPLNEHDVYIAYLPLAHVLELTAEMCVLAHGGALGYSSPLTLRDDGVCDENGKPAGDLGKLRPTIMAAVPLILDRLRAGVQEQVAKGPAVNRILFNTAFALKKHLYRRGFKTRILDKVVFSKVAQRFGGRLRYLLSGGAPLSPETHEFINLTVCAPVMQGYGLTETLCGGAITHPDDRSMGNVGAPVTCCQLLLRDVPEMGYTSADKPRPRGEIVIGGPNVSVGYFHMEKETAEAYYNDSEGVRHFCTGDIGEFQEDGTLKIIDRKKDLVKLSHGEYIALGNLESKYAAAKAVENICVVGDSHHGAPVALVAVNHARIKELAASLGISETHVDALCEDPAVNAAVLAQLGAVANAAKFEKWEKIAAVKLLPQPWTPESGLLTEAMKLKRHEISKRFKDDIAQMYSKVK